MSAFNRLIAILLWIGLLVVCLLVAINPLAGLEAARAFVDARLLDLNALQQNNPTNYAIAQAAFGIGTILLFAMLLWLEIFTIRRRGVRIRTAEGGSAELDTNSVGRRLAWHLDQLAEVMTVVPAVRARGSAVDVMLEIEAAPDVDIPLKTEEVVTVTREIIEQELGLKMGKLDVRMRCAPFEPGWAG